MPTAQAWTDWLHWLPAACYAMGALLAALVPSRCWQWAAAGSRLAFASALLAWGLPAAVAQGMPLAPKPVVAALVAFLGWIIGAYARKYLRGEPGQVRHAIALQATLASVSAVVAADHLLVLLVAWAASSIALHHLLTHYRDRPAALVVAHKKFLSSRLAELALGGAALLLYRAFGTLDLAALGQAASAAAATPAGLPASANFAAVLVAIAVLLKCAQLPLHGWLIQVMEAPTPVSALLHAGVVNLGGYVLMRLAPLLAAAPAAQWLLVCVGGATAALAGLVTLTRVTIKVRLAWSTCSQMGFMLLECGLGLHGLALLHLVAHSLYKAHAFLASGEAVRESLVRRELRARPHSALRSLWAAAGSLPIAWGIAALSAFAWHLATGVPTVPWIASACLASGLATLLWTNGLAPRGRWRAAALLVGATQLYMAWHALFAGRSGLPDGPPATALACAALAALLLLYALQAIASARPQLPWARRLYEWAYAGFYLDERTTRLAFTLWPVHTARHPARVALATTTRSAA